jgi:NSS family neurotransmitter:Na+ symporter
VGLLVLLGLPACLDTGVLERMDAVFGGVLLLLGGLLISLLLGWAVPERLEDDLQGCATPSAWRRWLRFALRWVAPPAIALGLVASVLDLVRMGGGG